MKIAIGSDHVGFDYKTQIIDYLKEMGHETIDCGTYNAQVSTHYPIYGREVGLKVIKGFADYGVVICGTGIGISNAANRVKGIRCALVRDAVSAKISRSKFNANVIGFGQMVIGIGLVKYCLYNFLNTKFNQINEQYVHLLDKQIDKLNDDDDIFQNELEAWKDGVYTNGKKQPDVDMPTK